MAKLGTIRKISGNNPTNQFSPVCDIEFELQAISEQNDFILDQCA